MNTRSRPINPNKIVTPHTRTLNRHVNRFTPINPNTQLVKTSNRKQLRTQIKHRPMIRQYPRRRRIAQIRRNKLAALSNRPNITLRLPRRNRQNLINSRRQPETARRRPRRGHITYTKYARRRHPKIYVNRAKQWHVGVDMSVVLVHPQD